MSSVPLLRWGIENSDPDALREASQNQNNVTNMDPELIEMILGKDDAVRMRECTACITDKNASIQERLDAAELLVDLVGSIDNANNVAKMGLWHELLPILGEEDGDEELKTSIVWLVASCCQNNPECSTYLMDNDIDILKVLLNQYTKASLNRSRKVISALSALFQTTSDAFTKFVMEYSGLDLLRELLEIHEDDDNLRTRILHALNFYCKLVEHIPQCIAIHSFFGPLVTPDLVKDSDHESIHSTEEIAEQ